MCAIAACVYPHRTFRPLLHYLSPLLLRADHVIATVPEGTFGTVLTRRKFKASSKCCDRMNSYTWGNFARGADGQRRHPLRHIGFHYPGWAARDFYAAGVTVGATADNHSFDRHERGVDSTLKALAAAGIVGVGTSGKKEAAAMKKSGALRPDSTADASPWYKITTTTPRGAAPGARPWRVAWIACSLWVNAMPLRTPV